MEIKNVSNEVGESYCVRGRIISKKNFGHLIFLNIQDETGILQLSVHDQDNHPLFDTVRKDVKVWDILQATGKIYFTDKGTKTLRLNTNIEVLSKFRGHHIDKYHGIKNYDVMTRVEQIILDKKLFDTLQFRSQMYFVIRQFMHQKGFFEVETPILLNEENTSKASSFTTILSDKNKNMYLRKTSEQHLKKMIIAGFGSVYELGKVFRNEGISKYYQPEFSALEVYKSYATYQDMQDLLFEMFQHIETELSLQRTLCSFETYTFNDFIGTSDYSMDDNAVVLEKFTNKLRSQRERNILITHFPAWINPLTKLNTSGLSEEFRFYVNGEMLAQGTSELTDYDEQKQRLIQQAQNHNKEYDPELDTFLHALKIGMPPCGGFGLGIDRLVIYYKTAKNIREVILFPK